MSKKNRPRHPKKQSTFVMNNKTSFMDTIIQELKTLYYPEQIDFNDDTIKEKTDLSNRFFDRRDESRHTYNLFHGRTEPYTENDINDAIAKSLPSFKDEPLYNVRLAALHELFKACKPLYVVVSDPARPGQRIKDLNDHTYAPKPLTHETYVNLSSEDIQLLDTKLCKLTDLYLHLTQDEKPEKIRQSDLDTMVVELLLNERLEALREQSPHLYATQYFFEDFYDDRPVLTSTPIKERPMRLKERQMHRVKDFAKYLILKQPPYLILQKPDLKQWDKFLFPPSLRMNVITSLDKQIIDIYDLFNEFFSRPLEYQLEYSFYLDALPANMLRWIDEQRIVQKKLSSYDNGLLIFSHIYKDFNDEKMINSEQNPAEGYRKTKHPGYAIKLRQAFQIQLDQEVLKEIQHLKKQYTQAHQTEFNVSVALIMISALTAGAYLNQMILWSTAAHVMIPAAIVSFVYAQWIISRPYLPDASEKNQSWDRYNLGFMLLSNALVLSIAFLVNTPVAPLIVIANLSSLSAHFLHRYIAFKQFEHAPCLKAVEAVTNDIKVQKFDSIFEIKHKKVNFKPLNCDTKAPHDEQTSTVSLM